MQGLIARALRAVPTQLSTGSQLGTQAEQAQVCPHLPAYGDPQKKAETPIFSLLLHYTRGKFSN